MDSCSMVAYLRCTAGICGVPTSGLSLFIIAISEQANCGKTFMVLAALKMMTGKNLAAFTQANEGFGKKYKVLQEA